jgi:hypothetical protein
MNDNCKHEKVFIPVKDYYDLARYHTRYKTLENVYVMSEEELKKMLTSIYEMCLINIPYYAYGDSEAACEFANQLNHVREYIVHELMPKEQNQNFTHEKI